MKPAHSIPDCQGVPRFRHPGLLFRILLAVLQVQRLRRASTPAVLRSLTTTHKRFPVQTTICLAAKMCHRMARFGLLDTCLVRCLVAGTFLRAHGEVRIHFGFRPGEAASEGHAWLTLDGNLIYDGGDQVDGGNYHEVSFCAFPPSRPKK